MLSALRSLGSPRARVIDCLIAQKIREWLYCPSGTVLSAFLPSAAGRSEELVNRDGSRYKTKASSHESIVYAFREMRRIPRINADARPIGGGSPEANFVPRSRDLRNLALKLIHSTWEIKSREQLRSYR